MTDKDITKIKVFGNDEDSLKTLGQLLSNETSRKIISCLNGNEMYINQISKTCGIQMNLTIHHIKKLEEVGLVSVVEKPIVRKGVNHKFYKMVPNIFVNTTQTKQEMKEKGFFKRFFKDGVKIAGVGLSTWFILRFFQYQQNISNKDYQDWGPNTTVNWFMVENELWLPLIASLATMMGLYFLILKRKKRN